MFCGRTNVGTVPKPVAEAPSPIHDRATADPTTGDLIKAKTIASDEVDAAVDVFMRDPTVSLFRFASGHTVDPAAAVKAHEPARKAVADPDRNEKFRRGMVRTAILLARPAAP